MSPLSNANYNKIVNVMYTIISDKLHRINEAGINKRMEKFKETVSLEWSHFECSVGLFFLIKSMP